MATGKDKNVQKVDRDLDVNVDFLKKELGVGESFDVIHREIRFADLDAALFFVDGFAKDDVMTLIMRSLASIKPEEFRSTGETTLQDIFLEHLNYLEVGKEKDLNQVVEQVLAGPLALVIDGEREVIIIDAREYPGRPPEEPDLEKVVRGSRDGFTETLIFNTALIRRRLRDPQLRFEIMQAGRRSKTDIAISYIKDIANPELIESIKNKISNIEIDGLPMAEKSVEELITPGSYWNPFPKVRFTERPDVAAVHLLEGHVLVLVDTSPSIIIAPVTFFHHLQHAEEYRQNPTVGVYTRWVRFIGVLLSIFLLPLWFLGSTEPEILPASLRFIGPEKVGPIPLFVQFFMAEIAIDFIRLATIHIPSPLATAAGVIAAVLIGDLAASIGFFVPEVILYTAIAAIGTFLTPSMELAMANRLVRLLLLVFAAVFKLPGFIVGSILVILYLATTKSFGVPYLWPLIPLNVRALWAVLVRSPVAVGNVRPSILRTKDSTSQMKSGERQESKEVQAGGKSDEKGDAEKTSSNSRNSDEDTDMEEILGNKRKSRSKRVIKPKKLI